MRNIILVSILMTYICSGADFSRYCDNVDNECVRPSFDCNMATNRVESFMCEQEYNAYSDNFFMSYYTLIMQNIKDSDKPKVQAIIQQTMDNRNKIGLVIQSIDKYISEIEKQADNGDEEANNILNVYGRGLEDPYLGILYNIEQVYMQGTLELTQYLLDNNNELFMRIFINKKKYNDLFNREQDELLTEREKERNGTLIDGEKFIILLTALYQDNLIDKTGRLIVKVDSR
ncbi:hypothetical protein B9T66_08505 [Helicobacter sp. TUL]|uniref:hypothetical protein n=1 Tax=Helicobacter sp. TUL TaxID=1848928 RepID=UPI000BAB9D00|nr:hypothetical protein [Helicobacter sp. TUL]PAU99192.1 hypothetical protein B9T66_08505 [Helicobacter sp. TUL]